jgi:hypothetical protein
VEGEPQADPDRAPARARVPQGKPPGGGNAAARCRRQVTRRGAGFSLSGDAEGVGTATAGGVSSGRACGYGAPETLYQNVTVRLPIEIGVYALISRGLT